MEYNVGSGLTACFNSGLLTATGGVTTYDTTVAIPYAIDGKSASKATVATGATPTTGAVSAAAITLTASQARCVLWCLISGGTVKLLEGPVVSWDGGTGTACPYPDVPDGYVPFAAQILKASSAAGTITVGSSNWNATGFTNAITNLSVLPRRPLTT
jgi:hypothetical protein